MSRIGKKPVPILEGVRVELRDGVFIAEGPKGKVGVRIPQGVSYEVRGKEIAVQPPSSSKSAKALWGLSRQLLLNAVLGAAYGFEKRLRLEGIGIRAQLEGKTLVLSLGFSHPVKVEPPEGIQFSVEKNIVTIAGADKQQVGGVAASLRTLKPPDAYKGAGIRYETEVVRLKPGKKAAIVK